MNTLMLAEQPMFDQQTTLLQWFRQYADEAGLQVVNYPAQEVARVIRSHLHEQSILNNSAESLEDLGIYIVFQHGQNRVALGGSTDEAEVNRVLARHQQEAYTEIRKSLGIDYLWVLKLTNLSHSANDLFEVFCQFFDLEQKPECCIVNL